MTKQRSILAVTVCGALIFMVIATTAAAAPYETSVVGTDFDYITATDPDTFLCLEYEGLREYEMPDKRNLDKGLFQDAYVFNAHFTDGSRVDIAVDQGFGSQDAAEKDALRYTSPLGRLPTIYRSQLDHIVVHKGGEDTTAFSDNGFFVIYSDNATKRITTHDLEETFFHESTHAAIEDDHLGTDAWKSAQAKDGAFITDYAEKDPSGEDMAESALFAYTLIHHPDRFPSTDRAQIEKTMPNRIAFFNGIFPTDTPLMYTVGATHTCSDSAAFTNDSVRESTKIDALIEAIKRVLVLFVELLKSYWQEAVSIF